MVSRNGHYAMALRCTESGAICYARSLDGIHWEKPVLGLVEFAGNKENNIVFGHGAAGVQLGQDGGMVFIDPNVSKDQKFNLAIRNGIAVLEKDLHIFSSPDGIHWKLSYRSVLTARPEKNNRIIWIVRM